MSWLEVPDLPPSDSLEAEEAAMSFVSDETRPGYEEKSGVASFHNLSYAWGVGLTTRESTREWELDGFSKEAAEAWLARDSPTSRTVGEIDLGDGGGIIVLPFRYVATETSVSRSATRTSEAGSYRLTLRLTECATTAQKLTSLTPEA